MVPSFSWALEVLVEEELGVVEARAHDALVAGDDGVGNLRVGVGHDHELAGELALGVEDREITLIGEHGLADNLLRNAEELLVELADEHGRPLAEVDDLVEDARGGVHVATGALGLDGGDALADNLLATVGGENEGILEDLLIAGRVGDDVLTGRKDTVAASGVAALHVSIGDRNDLLAKKRADPANRAHERLVLGAPALRAVVGPLDGCNDVVAEGRKNWHRGLGGHVLLGEDVLVAVLGDAAGERGRINTALAGKSLGGLGGIAVGIEGNLGLGPALDVMNGLGRASDAGDDGCEAARRGHDADVAMGEPGIV